LEKTVCDLQDSIDCQGTDISVLQKENEQLRITKSTNLVLYGVSEDTSDVGIRKLFAAGSDLPSLETKIVEIFRLGRIAPNNAWPRPLLIKCSSVAASLAAFKFARRLRGRSISMAEDLTATQQK
jgi:hypothetical protein